MFPHHPRLHLGARSFPHGWSTIALRFAVLDSCHIFVSIISFNPVSLICLARRFLCLGLISTLHPIFSYPVRLPCCHLCAITVCLFPRSYMIPSRRIFPIPSCCFSIYHIPFPHIFSVCGRFSSFWLSTDDRYLHNTCRSWYLFVTLVRNPCISIFTLGPQSSFYSVWPELMTRTLTNLGNKKGVIMSPVTVLCTLEP